MVFSVFSGQPQRHTKKKKYSVFFAECSSFPLQFPRTTIGFFRVRNSDYREKSDTLNWASHHPTPPQIKKVVFFQKKVQKHFVDIKMFLIFALLTITKATNV